MITSGNLLSAFLAGLASFFAPCLLPLFPSYFSAVSGLLCPALRTGFRQNQVTGICFQPFFLSRICDRFHLVGSYRFPCRTTSGEIPAVSIEVKRDIFGAVGSYTTGNNKNSVFWIWLRLEDAKKDERSGLSNRSGDRYRRRFILDSLYRAAFVANPFTFRRKRDGVFRQFTVTYFFLGLTVPFLVGGLFFPAVVNLLQEHRQLFHRISQLAGIFIIILGILLLADKYQLLIKIFEGIMAVVKL